MNYYENQAKEKTKKYRTNIKQHNQNYSITLFVVEEKLQISIKYSNSYSDEIFEYTNFYSFHQLQIINKYFRYFDNIDKICKDLDKLLKKNKVSIDDKNGYIILSIQVLMKKEKTNIIFKLKKKVTNRRTNDRINNSNFNYNNNNYYNKERSKNSISMPKYNEDEESKLKYLLNDLNDRVSMLENNHRYDSAPKEKMDYRYNKNNININDSSLLLGNINNIMVRMNRLEDLNKEKDDKIKELEDKISKYENNLSNTMSYPTYSLPNKSQRSKNEKESNNKKKKDSNQNDGEYEYEMNDDNKNDQKLRGKKNIEKEKPEYRFKKIEESKDQFEENNIKSSKRNNNIDNSKDENSRRPKKNNIKSKSQGKIKKREDLNSSEDNENSKNRRKKRNSYSSQKESEKSSTKDKKEKKKNKNRKEEERKSEIEEEDNDKNNKNEKESEKTSEKEEKNHKKRTRSNDSNSSEEKNKKKRKNSNSSEEEKPKKKNLNKSYEELQKSKAAIGLPMVEREEDLKKYINSRIFYTTKELQLVKNRITKNKEHLHCYFDILYRASIDRDYEDTINNLCEGHYPQLILFYTSEGSRFGAYIEKEKHIGFFGHESYKEVPGTCFLFSLNSLKTYDIKEKEKATGDRPERLCFGRSFLLNDNGSNWFIFTPRNAFLGSKCMIGDKENNFEKIDTSEIVGNKKDYILKEVEIFEVVFYSDDEDDDDENTKFIKEKEIRVKNFSKKKRNNNDTIKIKNMKIENEDNEED